jgi:hypothetical protein
LNTNLNWLVDAGGFAGAVVNQIQSWPAAVLLWAVLIIIGGTMKSLQVFPNKFIPVSLMLVGAVMYVITGDPGKVPPEQHYPVAIMAMRGIIVAFASVLTHTLVLKRFEKRFKIFMSGGDTEFTPKPEKQMSRPDIGLPQPPTDKPKDL